MPSSKPRPRAIVRPGVGWIPILTVIILLAAGTVAGWFFLVRTKNVPLVTVQRGTIVQAFYATGVVRPDFEYILKSRAQGALLSLEKREGAHVTKGELLARIDDRQLKYELEKNRAELEEAQKQATDQAPQRVELLSKLNEARQQLEIADSTLKRMLTSFDKGASTITDVDNSRRSHVQWANTVAAIEGTLGTWKIESQRRVDVAAANMRKAEANVADTEVRAPIDGIILERYVENQQVVGINEKLLLVAAPDDKLMKAAVDEEDITRTEIGQKVEMQLYAFQGREGLNTALGTPTIMEGKVVEILPIANPANKTYEVKVQFIEKPARLRVGMTGELNFIENDSTRQNVLVVPTSAVLDKKVYRPAGRGFEAVPVKIGVRTLDKIEIIEGLQEGDRIVADAKQVAPVKLPPQQQPVVPTRTGDLAEKSP